jgi:hypothetical protein
MTKAQYQEYRTAVAQFLAHSGIVSYATTDDRGFSWFPCQCCLTTSGGNRVTLQGIGEAARGCLDLEYSICTDCEYYLAYGQLDDMTMMNMESR